MTTETRYNFGAWFVLAAATALVVGGVLLLALRFSLPTDGWWVDYPEGQDKPTLIYQSNLVGLPSEVQPGDRLLAVEGVAFSEDGALVPVAPLWQAGRALRYTLERGGVPVEVDVPLGHWNAAALGRLARQQPGEVASLAGDVLFLALAYFTFTRRPGNKAARTLLFLAAQIFASTASNSLLPNGLPEQINLTVGLLQLAYIVALFTVLLPPTLLHFALVFPRPKDALLRRPWLEYAPFLAGLLMLPLFYITGGGAGWVWTVVSIVGAVALMVHSGRTMQSAINQAQLRWALGGMIAGLSLLLVGFPVAFALVQGWLAVLLVTLAGLGVGVMGLALAVAILRYRLFDIDVIIRRTLIYSLLTLLLGLVYFGSVVVLQAVFRALTGEISQLAVVGSTLAIAALFAPLRSRVQRFIDRRFFRRKYNAAQTLADFAATARAETDLDQLTGRLVDVVAETVQPTQVSLWLRPGNRRDA